jgi:hypothetical protein
MAASAAQYRESQAIERAIKDNPAAYQAWMKPGNSHLPAMLPWGPRCATKQRWPCVMAAPTTWRGDMGASVAAAGTRRLAVVLRVDAVLL